MASHPYHGPWPTVRATILERDNHACQIRGTKCGGRATDVDHIIPWQEGGAWYDPLNLRAACPACNRARGPQRMAAMAKLNRQPSTAPSRNWYGTEGGTPAT